MTILNHVPVCRAKKIYSSSFYQLGNILRILNISEVKEPHFYKKEKYIQLAQQKQVESRVFD